LVLARSLQALTTTTMADTTTLLGLTLDYGAGGNNGNIIKQTIVRPELTVVQDYQYDKANRIRQAVEGSVWSETYDYEEWSNGWVSAFTPSGTRSFTPQTRNDFNANNQFVGAGAEYFVSGEQKKIGGYQFTYDADGHLRTSTINSLTSEYLYDGEGRRVVRSASDGGTTVYVYDATGALAAEYGGIPPTLTGRLFPIVDHLGSTRLLTDDNGARARCYDYRPFGEELKTSNRTAVPCFAQPASGTAAHAELAMKFGGEERDSESGLDYFGARYFSSAQGRFTSPDPLMLSYSRLLDPQGLNLYAYTRNRPTIAVDDGGLATVLVTVGARQSATVRLHSDAGLFQRSYTGLARGQHRDRLRTGGDTPFGKYRITGRTSGRRISPAFGTGKINLLETAGEAKTSGRSLIRIHGGGSRLANPYEDFQPLIATFGCVRVCNADVEDFAEALGEEGTDGDDYVYVGTSETLKIMSLSEPMLRQALDREQAWQRLLHQVWLNMVERERQRQEKERELKEDVTSRIIP
jgi:RHS repeat-associated protein